MRKIAAMILAMALCCVTAAAEVKAPDYIMEGYDGDSTGCVWETNLFFSRMEEKTGISFEFRQASDYDSWKRRVAEIADGKNLPDILFKAELTPIETRRMYEAHILIDLKPYLEEYAPDLWKLLQEHPDWEEAVTIRIPQEDGTVKDVIAALPAFNSLQYNDYMWINTRWLTQLGLKKPTTADELTEVLRTFKGKMPGKTINGTVITEVIPLTFLGMWDLRFLGHAYGIIDNDYYVSVRNGKVMSSLTTDENRAFLTWLHTLWDEKLLDRNGFSTTESLRQITDEKKAIPYGMMMTATPQTVIPSASLGMYDILEPLSFGGEKIYRDLTGDVIRGTFAITRECKNPEKMISWVNYLYTEEGALLAQYGLEGEEYSRRDDGTWEWNEDASTVINTILPLHTISKGSAAPGIGLEDFLQQYNDDESRRSTRMMADAKSYSILPYPYVVLSDADAAKLAQIQAELMGYAEQAMACFVTGDLEMNDANWRIFCDTVHEKGLNEAIAIWQKYVTE